MDDSGHDPALAAARRKVLAFLSVTPDFAHLPTAALSELATSRIKRDFPLDLQINWNPSACTFDARWMDRGRPAEGLERPFSAESREDATLLACAGVCSLIDSLGSESAT